MAKLANKIALITGGTTGIGYETARLFRDEGATVIVTGVNPSNVAKAKAALGVEAVRSDATKLDEIDALMATIKTQYGRLDVLFANAGAPGAPRAATAVDEDIFDNIFGLNVRGLFFTVQKALPLLVDGSAIVLTASVAAHVGLPNSIVYAASKAAVRSLGRGFAAELLARRIRVNTLTPGLIKTPLMDKFDIPADQIIAHLQTLVPMDRAGSPLEAASAALFLACADSSFMTGAEIVVSGGQTDL